MSLKAAIIIPVYKLKPDETEIISFTQALRIFRNNEIILISPEGLDLASYQSLAKENDSKISIEYFDEKYFIGIDGYNKLMLSLEFYERFLDYEYILIHQLDCFVFEDELTKWVAKGYDYIGAPWINNDRRTWWTLKSKLRYTLKRFYRRYTKQPNDVTTIYYKVGNGGFSLRKVQKFCAIIKKFEKNGRIEMYREPFHTFTHAEDVFFSREVNRYFPNLKIPAYQEALNFAFEANPSLCFDLNGDKLPFGCHAWNKQEPDFWKSKIEAFGYKFD